MSQGQSPGGFMRTAWCVPGRFDASVDHTDARKGFAAGLAEAKVLTRSRELLDELGQVQRLRGSLAAWGVVGDWHNQRDWRKAMSRSGGR